eukprot:TRINITY_DN8022_c0_g3_i1.p1 TRINITY_DN8022_c0_g3~~TRINITY_DN8022_c0_g3_i1.p1  ORF type:complete len:727 (-),score=123.18 TRINITY_DN8022_c0_g3_i1:79-2259(-)
MPLGRRLLIRGGHVGEITHKESVYGYMIVMPPVSRRIHGHYCTKSVILGFFLFVSSVILQCSLVFIAGVKIEKDFASLKKSLIYDDDSKTLLDGGMQRKFRKFQRDLHDGVRSLNDVMDDVVEKEFRWKGKDKADRHGSDREDGAGSGAKNATRRPRGAGKGSRVDCCVGAECAGLGVQCCIPLGSTVDVALAASPQQRAGGRAASSASRQAFLATDAAVSTAASAAARSPAITEDDDSPSTSLCKRYKGMLTCSHPATLELGQLWPELDADGDGVWSIEEAQADAANLGCRLGVFVEDIFRSACRGLSKDAAVAANSGWPRPYVPIEVRKMRSIPKDYFTWFAGLAATCIYTDPALCSSMVRRGIFDGAMDPANNATGKEVHLMMVMRYCQRLVAPGGVCDSVLPGNYVMHRVQVNAQCGAHHYSLGARHANPHNEMDVMPLHTVSYENLEALNVTHSPGFQFFLYCVILIWFINLVEEVREILSLWDFLHNFPVDNVFPLLSPEMSSGLSGTLERASSVLDSFHLSRPSSVLKRASSNLESQSPRRKACGEVPDEIEVDTISRLHQWVCLTITLVRTIILVYFSIAGTIFLLSNRNYMDLLLNAMALAFIFDLDEFLYLLLVPDETKEFLSTVKPLIFPSSLPADGIGSLLISKVMWGVTVIPLLALYYVVMNDRIAIVPVMEALKCACLKTGEACMESSAPDRDWWNAWWQQRSALAGVDAVF